jgi:Restriction endonuclease
VSFRIIDQVTLYKPNHPVGIDAVQSLIGGLNEIERGTSKAVITTTSRFTRTVHKDFAPAMPGRLE